MRVCWLVFLWGCASGSAPVDPAPVPVEPAPAVDPVPELAPEPAAAGCDGLADTVWHSTEPMECGRGGGKCHWTVTFTASEYSWRYSDVSESGTWTCANGAITGTLFNGDTRAGTFADGALTWQASAYAAGEPPEVPLPAAPAPTAPAPTAPAPTVTPSPVKASNTCATASDCATSSLTEGSCCTTPCGDGNAYTHAKLAELKTWYSDHCDGEARRKCPVAACIHISYMPACREGRCVAVTGPGGL